MLQNILIFINNEKIVNQTQASSSLFSLIIVASKTFKKCYPRADIAYLETSYYYYKKGRY